jgi:hypothetical protein
MPEHASNDSRRNQMLRGMVGYFRRNVVGFLALFVALGGTAYAVNTVGSTDIIDGQVKSVDIGDGEVKSADVKDQSLTTFDVSTFLGADVVDGTLTGADVGDNSLKGADIDESTLAKETATTFANSAATGPVGLSPTLALIAGTAIPANDESTGTSWAVVATVNTEPVGGDRVTDVFCGLYNADAFIGGASSRGSNKKSLSLNGGAFVPANTRHFLWVQCTSSVNGVERATAQIMATRVGGFF